MTGQGRGAGRGKAGYGTIRYGYGFGAVRYAAVPYVMVWYMIVRLPATSVHLIRMTNMRIRVFCTYCIQAKFNHMSHWFLPMRSTGNGPNMIDRNLFECLSGAAFWNPV